LFKYQADNVEMKAGVARRTLLAGILRQTLMDMLQGFKLSISGRSTTNKRCSTATKPFQ
jgi:hypothetical protein